MCFSSEVVSLLPTNEIQYCWQDTAHMLVIVMTDNLKVEEADGAHFARDYLETSLYMQPCRDSSPPARVLFAGDPRPYHEAKHTMWVEQRKKLEKLKNGGFDEVIINSDSEMEKDKVLHSSEWEVFNRFGRMNACFPVGHSYF